MIRAAGILDVGVGEACNHAKVNTYTYITNVYTSDSHWHYNSLLHTKTTAGTKTPQLQGQQAAVENPLPGQEAGVG